MLTMTVGYGKVQGKQGMVIFVIVVNVGWLIDLAMSFSLAQFQKG